MWQRVAERAPLHRKGLASALVTHSIRLAESGQTHDAVESIQSAVRLWSELAAQAPVYRANYASALHNLAIQMAEVGQTDEAISAATEAVALFERLSEQYEETYGLSLSSARALYGALLGVIDKPRADRELSQARSFVERIDRRATTQHPHQVQVIRDLAERLVGLV